MQTEVATCLSTGDLRKLKRRRVNRASAQRVKKRLVDAFADMQRQVQEAQAKLQQDHHLCAVLQAREAALAQQVKHYTQLQNKACVENAGLQKQLAALAAAWDEECQKENSKNWQLSSGASWGHTDQQALTAQTFPHVAISSIVETAEAAEASPSAGIAPGTASSDILPDALIEDLPTMALPSPDTVFTDVSGLTIANTAVWSSMI